MKNALLAATILAVPLAIRPIAASAQPVNGLYVGAGGGANFLTDEKVFNRPGGVAKSGFSTGVVGLGSIGWGFGNGLRLEAEGDYRFDKQNGRRIPGNAIPRSIGGSERLYGGMVNALFDFDIGSPYVFPYAGIGVGYMNARRVTARTNAANQLTTLSYSTDAPAAQGIAGLSLPIPFVVGLSATVEYRFLAVEDTKDATIARSAAGNTSQLHKVINDHNQSAMIGLRYAFNVVPPAAPAAIAPATPPQAAPTRTYLVFFDWDRADLTSRARQIVADAAQASTRVQTTKIEVSGHADRTGTAPYNQALSMRRAETVAAELVRDGVARGAIDIHAYGDTRPLVATAAGVREPQNRRVEIVLR